MARTDTLGHFLTDVADAIRTKTGSADTITASDFDTEIENIPSGGGTKLFTGHYDAEGLSTIGWSSEEIQYYQDNGVQWNSSEDNFFKLTADELAGDDSSNTRFIPANSTKKSFQNYYKLLAIPLLDTSNTSYMNMMFNNCYSITTIPLLDTSNVINMTNMFGGCFSLEAIPLLNTGNVTTMNNTFSNCRSLKTIPLLDTSKVTNMSSTFSNCSSLKTIPLLDTSSATNVSSMFTSCFSLTTIPLLDVSSATNMSSMFSNCISLTDTSLDNILQMCIGATSYSNTKTLAYIGFNSTYYPASRIQALPHYQDFLDAGWTIGY